MKVDANLRTHGENGRYVPEYRLEPPKFHAARKDRAEELYDVDESLNTARVELAAIHEANAARFHRDEGLRLRIRSIVSSANSPELKEAETTAADSFTELRKVQGMLQDRYELHYLQAGAKMYRLLALDSFEASASEAPTRIGIMSLKTKARGADAAETHKAAEIAKTDQQTQALEALQRELHAKMTDALTRKQTLSRELRAGDDEYRALIQERARLDSDLDQAGLDTRNAITRAKQWEELKYRPGVSEARILDPMEEPVTVHEGADGKLNILVWRAHLEGNGNGGRWLQATGYKVSPGNVRDGAVLQLEDGTEASWSENLHTKQRGGTGEIAVITPAPGSAKLGREHGWGGLVHSIDSSG